MTFCIWLLPFSIIFLMFVHVIAYITTSFLFVAEYCSIICIYLNLFIHSSVEKYLGCSYLLSIVNNAAVNIRVHVLVFNLRRVIYLGLKLRDHMVSLCFTLRNLLNISLTG